MVDIEKSFEVMRNNNNQTQFGQINKIGFRSIMRRKIETIAKTGMNFSNIVGVSVIIWMFLTLVYASALRAELVYLNHFNTSLDANYSMADPKAECYSGAKLTTCSEGYPFTDEKVSEALDLSYLHPEQEAGVKYEVPLSDLSSGTIEFFIKTGFNWSTLRNQSGDEKKHSGGHSFLIIPMKGGIYNGIKLGWTNQFSRPVFYFLINDGSQLVYVPFYCDKPILSDFDPRPGVWHYVVATWTPTRVRLLIDGKLAMQRNLREPLKMKSPDGPMLLGAGKVKGRLSYPSANALIDDLRIYNCALYRDRNEIPVPREAGEVNLKPVVTIPYMSRPPTINGILEPDEWNGAARLIGFLTLNGSLANQQSVVWVGYDDVNLYVAFSSYSPSGVQATMKRRDDPVYYEDAIEIFLQPNLEQKKYYHFCGNALGTRYDAVEKDASWDTDWKMVCHREYDEYFVATTWTAEIAIPFRSLGLKGKPPEGARWAGNFCRDWSEGVTGKRVLHRDRWTTWAPVNRDFHNPASFATFIFSRESPAVQLEKWANTPGGKIEIEGHALASKAYPLILDWVIVPREAPFARVAFGEQKLSLVSDSRKKFLLSMKVPVDTEPKQMMLVLRGRNPEGKVLFRYVTPFKTVPALGIKLVPLYLQDLLVCEFDIHDQREIPVNASGKLEILTQEGKPIVERKFPDIGKQKKGNIRLDLSGIKPGDYLVKFSVVDADGKLIVAPTWNFPVPEKPEWFGNKLGISDKVPPPYTDMRILGRQINVWGRTYRLGELLLPEQITIQGTRFLAGPIELLYEDGSGDRRWEKTQWELKRANAAQALYEFRTENESASLRGSVKAEYDGFLLYDLTIEPRRTKHAISRLSIEIPLHRKMASFLRATTSPICKQSMSWSGPYPAAVAALIGDVKPEKKPGYFPTIGKNSVPGYTYSPYGWKWGHEFIPQFWVGDDYRGLFYFQDSPEYMNWEGSPVDVIHKGNTTVIRVNFINVQTPFEKPLHYKFALQATPLKKRDRRLERMTYDGVIAVRKMVKNKVPAGFFPATVIWRVGRCEKDYRVVDPEKFRKDVQYVRKHGVEVLLNSSNGFFFKEDPEFKIYGPEWMERPLAYFSNWDRTNLTFVKVCPASSFQDYYLWWLKNMIEKYDIGGVYLDMSYPNGCSSPYHGHGYEKDGKRYLTSNMFAYREFYKRMYTFLKEEGAKRNRQFFIYQHGSVGIITPFVDVVTRGEYWAVAAGAMRHLKRTPSWETMTPTYFRAVESVRSIGVPCTFYPELRLPPYSKIWYAAYRDVLARTLINDVMPVIHFRLSPIYGKGGLYSIWQAFEEFGLQDAKWVPYFENDPRVHVSSKNLLASFYIGEGRVMVVVSNLTDKPITASLKLDRQGLGLPVGRIPVKEVLTGDTSVIESDTIPIKVDSRNLVIIRIN